MSKPPALAKIDLSLIRILHTLLTTRSVSKSAVRLGMHQPGVSAALKRLRAITGDPILVRSGGAMVPTDVGRGLVEPSATILAQAEMLLSATRVRTFDPATSTATLRLAASDYLDPNFLPMLVADVKRKAPQVRIEILPLSADLDYRSRLASGEIDLVIGNWLTPPSDLHLGRLFSDEVVCMVAKDHPVLRRGLTVDKYLECEHVAPSPLHAGAVGVIDEFLAMQGLSRRITARCAYFGLLPKMVAHSMLILTTGRQFCERYVTDLPVRIVPCPIAFPPMRYFQLWHERSHQSAIGRWLREATRDAAARLRAM
jgi:DNA-binding transcriptional LysR family regulator